MGALAVLGLDDRHHIFAHYNPCDIHTRFPSPVVFISGISSRFYRIVFHVDNGVLFCDC